MEALNILQKKDLRTISAESYLSHTNSLYFKHKQKVLKFTVINKYLTTLFMVVSLNKFNTLSNYSISTRG